MNFQTKVGSVILRFAQDLAVQQPRPFAQGDRAEPGWENQNRAFAPKASILLFISLVRRIPGVCNSHGGGLRCALAPIAYLPYPVRSKLTYCVHSGTVC